MIKKVLIAAVLVALPLNNFARAIYAVPETINLQEAFFFLKNKGVIETEYENTDFTQQVSKERFIKMLLTALDFEPGAAGQKLCSDSEDGSVLIPYVNKAVELNAVYPLAPSQNCQLKRNFTRLSALSMIFQIAGIPTPRIFTYETMPEDLRTDSWIAPLISRALEINLIKLPADNRLRLHQAVNYQEAIELIYRTMLYINPDLHREMDFEEFENEIDKGNFDLETSLQLIPNSDLPNAEILLDVLNKLASNYYYKEKDGFTRENIVYKALESLMKEISDPFTGFQSPEDNVLQSIFEEDFEGVGLQIEELDGEILIANVFKNTPAEKAGLRAKDIIKSIDGIDAASLSLSEVAAKIKGKKGTSVSIKVLRKSEGREITVQIIRETINLANIEYELKENSIGVIQISIFRENVDQEFAAALADLKKQGMQRLIIDLRGNPGGLFEETLTMLGNFVEKGKALTHVKLLDSKVTQFSEGEAEYKNLPLVVLINESSASASEIFAAALQEYKLAAIVGSQSFGKGTVQEISFYDNNSIFKVTIAAWLTPLENQIQGTGITPDFAIQNSGDSDLQLEKAIEVVKSL